MTTPVSLHLATVDRNPFALGRSPEEARARAELHLRARGADLVNQARAAGFEEARALREGEVDLSDIDRISLPLCWTLADFREVLGGMWRIEMVESELEALGFDLTDTDTDVDLVELDGDDFDAAGPEAA